MDDTEIEINGEKLISLIKDKPQLFQLLPSDEEQRFKEKLWMDLCKELIPGWEEYTPREKMQIGGRVCRKWQSLRACFKKEHNLQRKGTKGNKLGKLTEKPTEFKYYDQLRFLLPADTKEKNLTIISENCNQKMKEDSTPRPIAPEAVVSASAPNNANDTPPSVPAPKINTGRIKVALLKQSPPIAKPKKKISEDKYFLTSLLPSLHRMTAAQKLKAKMRFLQTISDIENESQHSYAWQGGGSQGGPPGPYANMANLPVSRAIIRFTVSD